jgi:uncharacterized protein (DUF488 family)
MNLYTIGFTKKSARQFFELLKNNGVEVLLDIRLNNKSQLAGFTKGEDLEYFLSEICRCAYKHCLEYAPTKDILEAYKDKKITWDNYADKYTALMNNRGNYRSFSDEFSNYKNICLLCSEPAPENCHRRLIAEMIAVSHPAVVIKHL